MYFDFLYNFRLKHFSFREELSEIWSNEYIGLHVKYPLWLSDFNNSWIFLAFFYIRISNLKKIRPVGAELFNTFGRTDMKKLMVAFRTFTKAPNDSVQKQYFSPPVLWSYSPLVLNFITYSHHHHHHHVQEGLGLIPVPCILKMKLVPPSLPRSSYVSSSFWFVL